MSTTSGTITATARRQEMLGLEAQGAQLRQKLSDAEAELARFKRELASVAEQIALDREKPEKINEISRRIEQTEARIAGFKSVIASKDQELAELAPAVRIAEAAEREAACRARLADLAAKRAKVRDRINAKIRAMLTEDLPEFDALGDQMLAAELRAVGGQTVHDQQIDEIVNNRGQLIEEFRLIDNTKDDWMSSPAQWIVRGDVQLKIRNLKKL